MYVLSNTVVKNTHAMLSTGPQNRYEPSDKESFRKSKGTYMLKPLAGEFKCSACGPTVLEGFIK